MPEQAEPFLVVSLGPEAGSRSFGGIADLIAWIDTERESWQWLFPLGTNIGSFIKGKIDSIRQYAEQVANDPNPTQLDQLRNRIRQAYEVAGIPTCDSPSGLFIKSLADEDPHVAAGAATYLIPDGGTLQTQDRAHFRGAVRSLLFERGIEESAQSEMEALDRLRVRYEEIYSDQQIRFSQLKEDFEQFGEEQVSLEEGRASKFRSFMESAAREKEQFITEGTEKLSLIAKTYDEAMALEKPVTYWRDRAKHHENRSRNYGIAALSSGIVVALVLMATFFFVLGDADTQDAPPYWEVGFLAILAVFGLWLVRILVRLLLSHFHLKTDAEERAVMVQVFLSLSRNEAAIPDEDRNLVLQALFRPSATGIVKDDAVPINWAEFISRG